MESKQKSCFFANCTKKPALNNKTKKRLPACYEHATQYYKNIEIENLKKLLDSNNLLQSMNSLQKYLKFSSFLNFYDLNKEGDVLTNFYPAPFKLDYRNWKTSEHYFQAMKVKDVDLTEWFSTISDEIESKYYHSIFHREFHNESDQEICLLNLKSRIEEKELNQDCFVNKKLSGI